MDKDHLLRTISLTHFCEIHGPSIVFTSQMFPLSGDFYQFPISFVKCVRYDMCRTMDYVRRTSNHVHFSFLSSDTEMVPIESSKSASTTVAPSDPSSENKLLPYIILRNTSFDKFQNDSGEFTQHQNPSWTPAEAEITLSNSPVLSVSALPALYSTSSFQTRSSSSMNSSLSSNGCVSCSSGLDDRGFFSILSEETKVKEALQTVESDRFLKKSLTSFSY